MAAEVANIKSVFSVCEVKACISEFDAAKAGVGIRSKNNRLNAALRNILSFKGQDSNDQKLMWQHLTQSSLLKMQPKL